MATKVFLILAKSRKQGESCIAGREHVNNTWSGWVRPVSARPSHGISAFEQSYAAGGSAQVGDFATIEVTRHVPNACQTENWELNSNVRWVGRGRASWHYIVGLAENPATLWINGRSTTDGENNEVPEAACGALVSSLCMIHVTDFVVKVYTHYGKKKVSGKFTHNNVIYQLKVTDEALESFYLAQLEGIYHRGECCLTISLSEPFTKPSNGAVCRYKLIAGVLFPQAFP